jgi:hypothetical protein
MKKNGKLIAMVLASAFALAAPLAAYSQAASPGAYVGVGFGRTEAIVYECDALPTCSKKGTAYRFFGGAQLGRNLAIESGYTDLGHVQSSNSGTGFDDKLHVSLGEVTLLGIWPVAEQASLYGKLGAYYAKTDQTTTTLGVTQVTRTGHGNPTFGFGLNYFFTRSIALRLEGQKYMKVGGSYIRQNGQIDSQSDWTVYTMGVLWKFK